MSTDVMLILAVVASAVAAYLCGCFNGAVIVSKYILRDDIRNHGSGNAGLTNFYRTFGGKLTVVVLLLDVVKMIVAVYLGIWILREPIAPIFSSIGGDVDPVWVNFVKFWSGLWCLLGHMFPCMFGFKGGKGVLSGGTLLWMLDWRIALIAWGGFLLLVVLTRWVSLGSVWAGVSFPVSVWIFYRNPSAVVLALIPGGLLVWKHRGNIQRILKGTESKFQFHPKRDK